MALVTAIGMIFFGEMFNSIDPNHETLKQLNDTVTMEGLVWITFVAILSIKVIMQAPYFEGLFGRFRDDDY